MDRTSATIQFRARDYSGTEALHRICIEANTMGRSGWVFESIQQASDPMNVEFLLTFLRSRDSEEPTIPTPESLVAEDPDVEAMRDAFGPSEDGH